MAWRALDRLLIALYRPLAVHLHSLVVNTRLLVHHGVVRGQLQRLFDASPGQLVISERSWHPHESLGTAGVHFGTAWIRLQSRVETVECPLVQLVTLSDPCISWQVEVVVV